MVSQASSRGVVLDVEHGFRAIRTPAGDIERYETPVKGCSVKGDAATVAEFAVRIEKLMEPAPKRLLEEWLAELSVITAKRQDDDFTETLRIEAYASRLSRYPADVAREALLGKTWKFWPTWAELEELCDQLSAPRKAMKNALNSARRHDPSPRQYPEPTSQLERVSAERAKEIMREVFGESAAK